MVVVKHENDRHPERGQLIDQDRENDPGNLRTLYPKRVQNLLGADVRACPLQCADHMPPQPARVIVALVQRDPGERPALGGAGTPLRHGNGLPEARGSIDEHEPGIGTGQAFGERGPRHPLRPQVRGMELCLNRNVEANAGMGKRSDSAPTLWVPLPVPGGLEHHFTQRNLSARLCPEPRPLSRALLGGRWRPGALRRTSWRPVQGAARRRCRPPRRAPCPARPRWRARHAR